MLLVIVATFLSLATSTWHVEIAAQGGLAWIRHHLLTFPGLDELVHVDTMLFILGLTFFVSVIAQTRVLEGVTLILLRRYRGSIIPTVVSITAMVAMVSGVLGGVSLIWTHHPHTRHHHAAGCRPSWHRCATPSWCAPRSRRFAACGSRMVNRPI